MFGGVVLSTILEIEDVSKIKVFIAGIIATMGLAILGFIISPKNKKE